MQPGERALYNPAVAPQSHFRFDSPACDARHDAVTTQIGPAERIVVALVGMELPGPPSGAATAPGHGPSSFEERNEALTIVGVGSRQPDRQWQTTTVKQNVMLAAEFAAVGRVGARVGAAQGGKGR